MKAEIVSSKIVEDEKVIEISGYKHSFVLIVCASLLCNVNVTIDNVPNIKEKEIFCEIMDILGKEYRSTQKELMIYKSNIKNTQISNVLTNQIHGSIYLLPVLLYLNKSLDIFESGGCKIGNEDNGSTRPIENILKVMEMFGATRQDGHLSLEYYRGNILDIKEFSTSDDGLCGPYVSGATKTAILCALCAKGNSVIRNPYLKADVLELLEYLKILGVNIKYDKNAIYIVRNYRIENKDYYYKLKADVSEIITFISLAVYYNIPIRLEGIDGNFVNRVLESELSELEKMGVEIKVLDDYILVPKNNMIKATEITVTCESMYSDSQPFFAFMLLKANKTSVIREKVWKDRFQYAEEMKKVGAKVEVNGNTLSVMPGSKINVDKILVATDLRAAAVLVLLALNTEGAIIEGVEHIERGYENFWGKLRQLGVEISLK